MKKVLLLILSALIMLTAVSCGDVEDKFSVYCFKAGAADAFLLKTEKSAVLIDTAESDFGDEITDYLSENGIEKLDLLIVTHFDGDHVGGAAKILKKVSVAKVLRTEYAENSKKYENFLSALSYARLEPITVKEKYEFELDGAQYTVYPPEKTEYEKDSPNNSSLIVSVKYGENAFLFCGDAEKERISEFVLENEEHYDLIKMPHHGRWNKKLRDLIADTSPKYALITSSDEEPEEEKTVGLLNKSNIETYYTRKSPVMVSCDGKNIKVEYKK